VNGVRYLTLSELLQLYQAVMDASGGSPGIADLGLIESALAQPRATFGEQELYPDLPAKAAALGYSLITNHGFTDGNKRAGHAAMETFLLLNNWEIDCGIDEQERLILQVAAGGSSCEALTHWLRGHLKRS
jgi:death on curing protein